MIERAVRIGLALSCLWVISNAGTGNADASGEESTPANAQHQQSEAEATRAIRGGAVCGDDSCDAGETCVSCPEDCGECNPPIVEVVIVDSTNELNPEGTKSCQVLLRITEPGQRLLAVGNVDITTSDPDGFFQHPFGSLSTSPACFLIPTFPDLTQDSYVTFTVECNDGSDGTSTGPNFNPDLFNTGGGVVGGWFNFVPPNGQGDPDAEGNVLIAQFTVHEEHNVCGTLTAFVQGDFGIPSLPCPDFNGDGIVNATDLAVLLGNLGSCGPGCIPGDPVDTCLTDLDGDCVTGLADLAILLSSWGLCDPEILPVVGFPVSVECPSPIPCFLEIPTLPKWSQPPHEMDMGFNVASDVDWQTLADQPPGDPGPGPNQVIADDFISDGRPISALRWWGAYLDPAFEPGRNATIPAPPGFGNAPPAASASRTIQQGSNCCEPNGGAGCDDPTCQDLVCGADPLCCLAPPVGGWNEACVDLAELLCGLCGASTCCTINPGVPGCDDPSCEAQVCEDSPSCCEDQWDVMCLAQALGMCQVCVPGNPCGEPDAGDCCGANGTPGCDDDVCCNAVCTVDPFCCQDTWDQICADAAPANPFCSCAGGPACPGEGDCFNANGTPGCEDADCCEAVCAANPSCCEGAWNDTCADLAFDLCAGTDVDAWLISFHTDTDDPAEPNPVDLLGLYACPAPAVQIEPAGIVGWDELQVFQFETFLEDCCLLHAALDPRDAENPLPPARADKFQEVAGFFYWLDIQAVVGHTFQKVGGTCLELDTSNRADDHFWGWFTGDLPCLDNSAAGAVFMDAQGAWDYTNWTPVDGSEHDLNPVNQAYQLLTLVETCRWDFAGAEGGGPDGKIGAEDLAGLLGNWGPYTPCEPPFGIKVMDFNGDIRVDAFDLAELLGRWGACHCFGNGECPSNECQDNECVPLP